ncbi:DDE-type integrase/transposase/recombinase [Bradyrhizobium sp. Arg62]|uniref:Mu transposase C-terminal domain-containing protein n=1 Tax=Bradyrhizobium brasilense TaxID=1419277 RepID=UPI001E53D342|nr:Mu transposase C-terminal domain-containing protein [Bradyrhizobium brasilense]MCC8944190.1 DDE-type integrase/transposase/recombinase [Bradyrhizobium brasilense]
MYAFKGNPLRRFNFGPLDRIIIRSREYRWVSSDKFGHVLTPALGIGQPITEGFSHEELDELVTKDQLAHDIRFYDQAKSMTRLKNGGAISLFDLSANEQNKLLERQEIVDLVRQHEVTDPDFVRTDAHLKKVLKTISATLFERNQARAAEDKQERCDQKFEMSKLPSARTVRRWRKAYESSGFDVMSLRDGHHRSGNQYSNLNPEVLQLIDRYAAGYCDRRRPTMALQYDQLAGEIRKINTKRGPHDQLATPCKGTFRKAIKAIPAFDTYAGRYGLDAAKRKFAIVASGMESVRAFQRLVMDGHKTQLSTIAVKTQEWDRLSPEAKRKAARERLILHLSICSATRCVTGIRFSPTENKETAIALLRMSVSDKTRYAQAAGCKSDWLMTARPGSVHTDTGSAWIATEFRSCVADLRATLETAPVGLPQMRGHGERAFGTFDRGLLPHFSGRTFGSIQEKGDYDPAVDASLFSENLGFVFVRYIVDKYHHTPHAALNGMTPYNKWLELVERYGILPPPSSDELRNVFGPRIERALDQRGVRVAGIHYQSSRLQDYRRKVGDTKVAVKFDAENLGKISVWVDEGWLTVPAVLGSFAGIHLDHWTEAVRDLRRRNLVQSLLSQHFVDSALRDLASMGRLAMAHASVSAHAVTAEELERSERELLYGFDVVGAEDDTNSPVTANRNKDGNRDRFSNAVPITDHPTEAANTTDTAPEDTATPSAAAEKPTVRTRKPNLKLED